MNNQASAKVVKLPNQASNVSTINSSDALAMIEHSSEMTIGITTPVGTKFRCKTQFIGTHPDNLILIEIPPISKTDLDFYFQPAFWMNIRAISPRGEGAQIHFKSQIKHVIQDPIAMISMTIPNTMQINQLRKEPRYDIHLEGAITQGGNKTHCEIRDLSKSGCRFFTAPLGPTFQVGDVIMIEISENINQPQCPPLFGTVCNLQRSTHHSRYGLEFSELGRKNAKTLLSRLRFNGTKLTFSNKTN